MTSGGLSKSMVNLVNDLKTYSKANNLGYDMQSYTHHPMDPGHFKTYNYIMENSKNGEPIILYGYSLGGLAVNQLAKMLSAQGIRVHTMIMVDPAISRLDQAFGFSNPEVSSNVDFVMNYYQTSRKMH